MYTSNANNLDFGG